MGRNLPKLLMLLIHLEEKHVLTFQVSVSFSEKLLELATCAGFEVLENRYVQKQTINHKEGISAPRIFLQAKLRKCAPSKMQQDTPPMEL